MPKTTSKLIGRAAILSAALLLLCSLVKAQGNVVQQACAQQSTATTTPIPFTSNPVTGRTIIVVMVHTVGSTIQNVTDTLSNSYAARGTSYVVPSVGVRLDAWTAQNITNVSSSADTVTVTNDSANLLSACIYEVSGVLAASFDVTTVGAGGTGATATTAVSATTAQANSFLFQFSAKDHSEAFTAGAIGGNTGTLLDSFANTAGEVIGTQWTRVTNGPATYTGAMATGNVSASWGTRLLVLKESPTAQNFPANVSETLTTSDSTARARSVVRRIVDSAWRNVKRSVVGK